jgi:hypothetical protein
VFCFCLPFILLGLGIYLGSFIYFMSFCFCIISCFGQFLSFFSFFLSSPSFLCKTQTDIAWPECTRTYTLIVLGFATGKDVQCTMEVTFWNPYRIPCCVTWLLLWFPLVFLPVYSSFSYIIPRHIMLSLATSLLSIQLRKCGLFLIS